MKRQGFTPGPGWLTRADAWLPACCLVVMAVLYAWAHAVYPPAPHGSNPDWWGWFDQGKYLRAAEAWASGNFDPDQHWYPPAYPLFGALFVRVMPRQPFYIPDLLCLLGAAWLFAAIARRLAGGAPGMRAAGALLFALMTAATPLMLNTWIVPWSSTLSALLTYAAMLSALRFIDRMSPGTAFATFACASALAACRPSDCLAVAGTLGPLLLIVLLTFLLTGRIGVPGTARIGLAAISGAALSLALTVAAHVAINGWMPGGYMRVSGAIGSEWRLIPLRWVTLFVSPGPLFQVEGWMNTYAPWDAAFETQAWAGRGIARLLPWVAPGVCGMVAVPLFARGRDRWRHAAIVLPSVALVLFYLSYRDLHPQGLWRYHNVHYFKAVIPLTGLYALLLGRALILSRRRLPILAAAACAFAALFCWRPDWRAPAPGYPPDAARWTGTNTLLLSGGLHSVRDGVLLRGGWDWDAAYMGDHSLTVDGRVLGNITGIKLVQVPGGAMMELLRPIPPGPAVLRLDTRLRLDEAVPPVIGRQVLLFGPPCWFGRCGQGPSAVPAPVSLPDDGGRSGAS